MRARGDSRPHFFAKNSQEHVMVDDFKHRIAGLDDLQALHTLMARAIGQNQSDFLTPEQVAASDQVMGLDTQLVHDGTYFMIEAGDRVAGCGGWSFRATLYGGDDSMVKREPERLDPATDAAKVRAMYTDPDFVRRGIGSMILSLCEGAAKDAGFKRVELMGTAAGVPLYLSRGYVASAEQQFARVGDVEIPLLRMEKSLV
jgi:GNAT superfamily N-acetyltransferase